MQTPNAINLKNQKLMSVEEESNRTEIDGTVGGYYLQPYKDGYIRKGAFYRFKKENIQMLTTRPNA